MSGSVETNVRTLAREEWDELTRRATTTDGVVLDVHVCRRSAEMLRDTDSILAVVTTVLLYPVLLLWNTLTGGGAWVITVRAAGETVGLTRLEPRGRRDMLLAVVALLERISRSSITELLDGWGHP